MTNNGMTGIYQVFFLLTSGKLVTQQFHTLDTQAKTKTAKIDYSLTRTTPHSDVSVFSMNVGILENDAAFTYALLLFPLSALDSLFRTINFRK